MTATKKSADLLDQGEFKALPGRKLTEETCRKWGYSVGLMGTERVQIATYRDPSGTPIAQKVRTQGKDFKFLGRPKEVGLYGQHLWRDGGKMVVVTEGELDALSVSQVQGNKWPVVSVPNGANGAAQAIRKALDWLMGFETVVFMFDMDDPGRAAAKECAALLPPGRAKIAALPLKDASEMLQAGRGAELVDAIWGARAFRPDGIVSLSDLRKDVLQPLSIGAGWPWPTLTSMTFGRRAGEVYALGAGTGVGKTDLFTQLIAHDLLDLQVACGVIYLEQPPVETARRIAGKVVGKRFHIPDGSWTAEELADAFDRLEATGRLHLYAHFGSMDWPTVAQRVRYMVTGLGCRHIFLDHLTALAAGEEDERKTLENVMAEMAGLAQELGCIIHFISHLATPEGKPHEEGGRVMIRHFKGSRAIGFWSHFMFGLERNQQAEDPDDRSLTTLRCLKDRYTGQATGQTILLRYNPTTGMLTEAPPEAAGSATKGPDDHSEF